MTRSAGGTTGAYLHGTNRCIPYDMHMMHLMCLMQYENVCTHPTHTRRKRRTRVSAVRRKPDSQSTWIDAQPDVRDQYIASRARYIQALHTSLFFFFTY